MSIRHTISMYEIKAVCHFLKIDFDKLSIGPYSETKIDFFEKGIHKFTFKQYSTNGLHIIVPGIYCTDKYSLDFIVEIYSISEK